MNRCHTCGYTWPPPTPDNGGPLDDATLTALLDTVERSDVRAVMNGWLKQADGTWDPRVHRTVRHLKIARAAHALATATGGDDDCTRLLLATVAPDVEHPSVPVGVALSALTIDEARHLVAVAEAFGNRITLLYDEDGSPYLDGDVDAVLAAA